MEEEWMVLEEFPTYAVSNLATFTNLRTGIDVHQSRNQMGHAKITLVIDGRQKTRSVAHLVGDAFIPRPHEFFDTPIHLDGDLMNCRADNLMWRPRWFAIKYHRQFRYDGFHTDRRHRIDVETGEHYYSMKELCMRNGVYHYDVVKSCYEGVPTAITLQYFEHAEDEQDE